MNTKNLLVSFIVAVSVLFLISTVSAAGNITNSINVEVNGIDVSSSAAKAIITEDAVTVKVQFTSEVYASDVSVEAEIEGYKVDVSAETAPFDVEANSRYRKTLSLRIPFDLEDKLSDDVTLELKISGQGYKSEEEYTLRLQRESFDADIKSVSVSQSVDAGETFPVDIVLKNLGYNDLEDLYVTVKISKLGIERTSYFGDIVALECDDENTEIENYGVNVTRRCNEDEEDTVSGRLFLKVPYEVAEGVYTLEVEVTNDDTTSNVVKQIAINNDFSKSVMSTTLGKSVAVNEKADYSILLVNPTNKLKVYRVVSESSDALTSRVEESVIAVPAGSSKTVKVTASASAEGEYNFNVNIFSANELVDSVTLGLNAQGRSSSNPIVVLTVVLAIVFLVLLIVLIVLIGKKPEKTEEFSESYY